MTTAYRVDEIDSDMRCTPAPFSYEPEGSYVKQLLLQAAFVIVLAAITVTMGFSLATGGA